MATSSTMCSSSSATRIKSPSACAPIPLSISATYAAGVPVSCRPFRERGCQRERVAVALHAQLHSVAGTLVLVQVRRELLHAFDQPSVGFDDDVAAGRRFVAAGRLLLGAEGAAQAGLLRR